ncbi:MAG: DUF4388 domain-containing protein [Actinomycetota bacterium]
MLKGTLDDFTLPDVFRMLHTARKTGQLEVERSAGNGTVFIREGDVYYAESSLAREPLGQKLIRSGALTDSALMKALDENASTGQRVGEILIAHNAVTVEQLQRAVRQQIEDSVFDLMRWEAGSFEWQSGVVADVEVPIAISVENLIMEASRRLDELEVINRKIPSNRTVLAMAPRPPEGAAEINIQPEEWRMFVLVNGSRTVGEIADLTGTDDFSAIRGLYGLVSAGLVVVVDAGTDPTEAEATETLEAPASEPSISQAPLPRTEEEPAQEPAGESLVDEPELEIELESESVHSSPEAELVLDEPGSDQDEPGILESFELHAVPAEPEEDVAGQETSLAEVADLLSAIDLESDPAVPNEDDAAIANEVPIDSFDQPGPDELVTRTPEDADAFLNELFEAPAPSGPGAPEASPTPQDIPPPEPSIDETVAQQPPAPSAPESPAAPSSPEPRNSPATPGSPDAPPAGGHVDRAAAVRELAGLFSDDDRPRSRSQAPKTTPESNGEDTRKRVEDDDQINKGLIGRLINGVKGL